MLSDKERKLIMLIKEIVLLWLNLSLSVLNFKGGSKPHVQNLFKLYKKLHLILIIKIL